MGPDGDLAMSSVFGKLELSPSTRPGPGADSPALTDAGHTPHTCVPSHVPWVLVVTHARTPLCCVDRGPLWPLGLLSQRRVWLLSCVRGRLEVTGT